MHLLKRRSFVTFLLFMAALGGLFPPGAPFPQSDTARGHPAPANAAIYTDPAPLSSAPGTSSLANKAGPLYHALFSSNLYALTAGLRPGRGVPIPDAADVPVLPVQDVSFYNWRGELRSGWLALTTPGAPVIILNHGMPGNRMSMLSRAAFLFDHGFNVLLFDFQSYGKSQGVMSTLGMVESEDILAAISYLHSLPATIDR